MLKLDSNLESILKNSKTVWIAYSGGVDSHSLLHYFATNYSSKYSLKAIHINHGLSPYAKEWESHCRIICDQLSISLEIKSVVAKPEKGESPEDKAREARYKAFKEILGPDDFLLTAHQQNDQAETFLLQLMRGAGVRGLSSMPSLAKWNQGFIFRPLLECSRQNILNYAHHHYLKWIDDESNGFTHLDRNFIRHDVVPLLQKRWPSVSEVLPRVAKHSAESEYLLNTLAQMDLENNVLFSLPPERQKNIIRYWLKSIHFPIPNEAHMKRILEDILHCSKDANPVVRWNQVELRRYRDQIYALKQSEPLQLSKLSIPWDFKTILKLPGELGELKAQTHTKGVSLSEKDLQCITIQFRKGGERIRPAGRSGTHSLKKLFQEWGVPPWQRDEIPLIYRGSELIGVVGYCNAESVMAKPNIKAFQITQERLWEHFMI